MKKWKSLLLPLILLLVGLGILTYPMVSDFINSRNGSYAIAQMQQRVASADAQTMAQQRRLAEAYNQGLPEHASEEEYASILDFGEGIMGTVQIPKIQVDLPIYHGVSEEVLAHGVGHMPQTAFPIGGEGNHAVLTGHTGLPSARLFTDLTELEEGDVFHVSVLGEVLTYEVDQIKVVLPSEGQDLTAVPGEDYCTLVTCTPYGVNSHRLLVRGTRTQAQETLLPLHEVPESGGISLWMLLLPLLLLALLSAAAAFLIYRKFLQHP